MKAILKKSAVAGGVPLKPGMVLDSEDAACPLSKNDVERFVKTGIAEAVETTEAEGKPVAKKRAAKKQPAKG